MGEKKQPKKKGGKRKGAGRPKVERPPEVKDSQFAARVLGQVGQARWKRIYQAIREYESFPARHAEWGQAAFYVEVYPDQLSQWESRAKSERGKKPKIPADPGPEPKRPPHPKELIEGDEDLALYYLVSDDLALANRTFIVFMEKRDGKAMHTVNHLHDKPIEHNHTIELGEGMRQAMELAEKRVSRSK